MASRRIRTYKNHATYNGIKSGIIKLGVMNLNNLITGLVIFTKAFIKKKLESSLWKIFIADLPIKVHIIIPSI